MSAAERWQQLSDRFDALSIRERALLAATTLSVVWALWVFVVEPFSNDRLAAETRRAASLTSQLNQASQEQNTLQRTGADEQLAALQQQIQGLRQQLQEEQAKLDSMLQGFVSPAQTAAVVEGLVAERPGLALLSVQTYPAQAVALPGANTADQGRTIYRHPITITVKGDYRAVVGYVRALEQARWQLAWRGLHYVVEQHPDAVVRIELETLSQQQEWLGA